ncbi:MAG: rhodanese-like domain-containing protein [Desulfomonilaceae bacterium]|nr:rhodanese-like domain-containing protein [Desulfomonilaceae bacterium]
MKRFLFFLLICIFAAPFNTAWGAEIKDSESATHGSDASMHRIVDSYAFPGFKVIQITLPVLSVYSYLLVSQGEALLVDPVRDVSFYLETAKKEGARIKGVYLTHSHADFIAGHTEMKKALNVPIYQSHKSGAGYPINAVDEKSSVNVGSATLKFLDTPGHTPDGQCCAVYSKENSDAPKLLFTGDVLFVGSVGRPDLLEGTVSAAWLAAAMYDSWTDKLSKLPDDVMIFPAHGAGSLCGANLSKEPKSTIGEEKKTNPYLKAKGKGEFIALVLQGLPEAPQYFQYNAKMNREGPPPVDWDAPLPKELEPSVELTDPDKHYVVDLRDARAYAEGHVPNSVNIAARGRLETWVGTMVPWGSNLILVGDADLLEEARHRLSRVGYKGDIITMESWKKAGSPIAMGNPITPRDLYALMRDGKAPLIVDVRLPAEWMALRIGTILNLPLDRLSTLSSKLDPEQPVVLVCNSAYRSSMAAGILERQGFKNARNLEGGSSAWIKADLPVYEGEKTAEAGLVPVEATVEGSAPLKAKNGDEAIPKAERTPKPVVPEEGC